MVRLTPAVVFLPFLASTVSATPIIGEIIESLKLKLTPQKLQDDMTTAALKLVREVLRMVTSSTYHSGYCSTLLLYKRSQTRTMERVSLVAQDITLVLVSTTLHCQLSRGAHETRYEAYVSTIAKLAGYDVQKQSLPWLFEETLVEKLTAGSPVNVTGMGYSPSTPVGGITAPLVYVPDAEAAPSGGCTVGDYAGVTVTGAIALIQRGGCSFAQKVTVAKQQGAVGAISKCYIVLRFEPMLITRVSSL